MTVHTLMTVLGHPDDEVFHAGATLARYTDGGARAIVVTGTRGELGRIAARDLDTPANRASLGELRMRELRAALAHVGVTDCRWLGYRDSGLAGSPRNADPEAFCSGDIDVAVGRLVALVRETRPHVLLTHNESGGDGHPDHVRAGLVARLAFDRAGDPAWYPEQLAGPGAAEPWAPLKLYEVADQFDRRAKLRRLVKQRGILGAAPFLLRRLARWRPWKERERARAAALHGGRTTRVDVRDWVDRRHAALLEFRSQIGPGDDEVAMTPDERRWMVPTEDFYLRASRVAPTAEEEDLLAGL